MEFDNKYSFITFSDSRSAFNLTSRPSSERILLMLSLLSINNSAAIADAFFATSSSCLILIIIKI